MWCVCLCYLSKLLLNSVSIKLYLKIKLFTFITTVKPPKPLFGGKKEKRKMCIKSELKGNLNGGRKA